LATSSSAERLLPPRTGAAVIYAALIAAGVFTLGMLAGRATATAIAISAVAAAAVYAGAFALFVARLRRLRQAAALAAALAQLRFDARATVADGEFAELASSLNAAAANIGRLVSQLRQERAQLEALLNASSDATVAVDGAGLVTYTNDAARRLFPSAESAAVGRPFIEAVRDHDLNDLIEAAARRGERSVRVVAYGATQRWLQATAVPIDGGGNWAALAVFHDLTEVRRLDSVRRDFISNVSHELRTPLAGIRAAAETLHEGAIDDPPAATEFVGHILRETDRLTQLVDELIELSRIESGAAPMTFAPIDVSSFAQAAVRRFAQQAARAGLTLAFETSEDSLSMLGDNERLERALGNLIANALKFSDAGGAITVRAASAGTSVALSVSDTGVGIEPEQQGRVFERFYKADRGRGAGGTGLGLAIVKHIVLAHGGSVSLESRPGRGATFTMLLPRR
jgi:two-component system phosphate regulon sensor histidine kinase PhoR